MQYDSLILAILLVGAAHAQTSEECVVVSDAKHGYSVCAPKKWYRRQLPSGAFFLCDDMQGRCVTSLGGGPLVGHATISLLPASLAMTTIPNDLQHFAQEVSGRDPSSRISEMQPILGRATTIHYITVTESYKTGAVNELPQQLHRYFVQADSVMVEILLAYNSGDKRSAWYRSVALNVARSLMPVSADGQGAPSRK
jgi:hypothetical protein